MATHLQSTESLTTSHAAAAAGNVWWSVLLLLILSVGIRLINLDYPPRNDELYTLMAARGWLEHGVPRIGAGVYDRAELYTVLVAQFFRMLGESLVVARLPAVLAGSLLVVAVFLWVRAVSGSAAAWVAALFMALAPLSVQEAQFARFYALHALLFWLAAIGVFAITEQRFGVAARLAIGVGVASALALALHLQPTTIMGLAGLGLWVIGAVALSGGRWRWPVLAGAFLLAVAVLQSGHALDLWQRYRGTPLHAEAVRDQVWFYHLHLIERWPSLWPLLPFAVLLAIAAAPRPALFCTVVFGIAFALLSFGGMKHLNYLFFAYPFLFVIWALALVRVYRILRGLALGAAAGALHRLAPGLASPRARMAMVAAGLVFLVFANGAPARAVLKPLGITLGTDETAIDWSPAAAVLAPWLERAAIVLTPNDMHALYYLEAYDVAVNASRMSETRAEEFALDRRTGRPMIGTTASLALILDCYPSGLLVVDDTMYRVGWALADPMADLIERRATAIEVTPGLRAFFWEQPEGGDAAACLALPDHLPGPAGG